jgi:hypothetical protein
MVARANGGQGAKMAANSWISMLVSAVVVSGFIIAVFYLLWD